jgi:hypothetical protein
MRNTHTRTWNMARNLENREKGTQTLFDLEFLKKHSKKWKMRNAHSRTWRMARKLKKVENEKHTL